MEAETSPHVILLMYTFLKISITSVQDAEHDQVLEKMSNGVPRPCLTSAVREHYLSLSGVFFVAAPLLGSCSVSKR